MIYILAVLAIWRLTAMLVYDDAAQGIRDHFGVGMEDDDERPIGLGAAFLGCFWCCSIPVSAIMTIVLAIFSPGMTVMEVVLCPWALSGAAILLNHNARIHLTME